MKNLMILNRPGLICICVMMTLIFSCNKSNDAPPSFVETNINGQRSSLRLDQSLLTEHYFQFMTQQPEFDGLTYNFSFRKGDTVFAFIISQEDGSKEIRTGEYTNASERYYCSLLMTAPSIKEWDGYSRSCKVFIHDYNKDSKTIRLSFNAETDAAANKMLKISGALTYVPLAKKKMYHIRAPF